MVIREALLVMAFLYPHDDAIYHNATLKLFLGNSYNILIFDSPSQNFQNHFVILDYRLLSVRFIPIFEVSHYRPKNHVNKNTFFHFM